MRALSSRPWLLLTPLLVLGGLFAWANLSTAGGASVEPTLNPSSRTLIDAASPQPTLKAPSDVTFEPATPGPGMISREQAIASALAQYPLPATAHIEAYLGTTTDATTVGAVSNRAVWIVHLSGISYPVSIPAGARLSVPPRDLANGYIYVDAYNGGWILSRYEN